MAKKTAQKKDATPSAADRKMTVAEFHQQQRMLQRSPELAYQRACNALEKHRSKLQAMDKNIVGFDVGMKLEGRDSTRQFAIWIYVKKKERDAGKLGDKRIPEFLDDVPTDVIEVPNFVPASSPPGGTAIAANPTSGPMGTLGFDVRSSLDARARLLTCTHVVSPSNAVSSDTQMFDRSTGASLGVVLEQKGSGWEFSNLIDCALIKPPNPGFSLTGIPDGAAQPRRLRRALPGDVVSEAPVWKLGAATGLTTNGILVNHKSGSIQLGDTAGTIIERHILIKPRRINGQDTGPFAVGGDSGSIVCIGDEAIGIIRAVDDNTQIVVAAPIVDAAAALDFGI